MLHTDTKEKKKKKSKTINLIKKINFFKNKPQMMEFNFSIILL